MLAVLLFLGSAGALSAQSELLSMLVETPGRFGDSKLLLLSPVADEAGRGELSVVASQGGWLVHRRFLADSDDFAPFRPAVAADWLAVCPGVQGEPPLALVSAFGERSLRLYRLFNDGRSELVTVLEPGSASLLRIDPTLVRIGGRWLATCTEVEGAVNNSDPAAPNGRYTVVLHESADGLAWRRVGALVSANANLEDGRLFSLASDGLGERLAFLYEREACDRGPSSLELLWSDDRGRTWQGPRVLLADGADNEPAGLQLAEGQACLWLSSDQGQKGASYAAGEAQALRFSLPDWRLLGATRLEEAGSRLLLLDARQEGDGSCSLLGLRDYLGARRLVEYQGPAAPSAAGPAASLQEPGLPSPGVETGARLPAFVFDGSTPPPVGVRLAELRLQDGRVLRELVVLGYSAQSLVARWEGGRGTIRYRDLPLPLASVAERHGLEESRRREQRDRERLLEARSQAAALRRSGGATPGLPADVNRGAAAQAAPLELRGQAFVSGGYTSEDQVQFSGMQVAAYPLREALLAAETVMARVEWPRPLAVTATDAGGSFVLRVPAGVPFLLVAESRHYATRTGRSTLWSWRLRSDEIANPGQVQLTDQNARKVWRVQLRDPRRDGPDHWHWQHRGR